MKKIWIAVFVLGFNGILPQPGFSGDFKINAGANYYAVSDSLFKEIYGSGGLMFSGSLGYEVMKHLEVIAEASYYQDTGKMTLTGEEIKFTITPLVLAVRGKLPNVKTAIPYLGIGFEYFLYKEELPDRLEDVSDSTAGFHVETGVYVNVLGSLFLDLNVRYIQADAKPFDETIKLGGWRAGLGVGFRF
jgi:opacity protein-like surface antigen